MLLTCPPRPALDPIDETARGHRFEHRPEKQERIVEIGVGRRHWAVHRPVNTRRARPRPAELAGTLGGPAQPRNRDETRARPRLGSRCQRLVLA